MSCSSDSVPLTSFAASGSSFVTATITCDTPSSCISSTPRRRGLVRRDDHEVGDRVAVVGAAARFASIT